MSEQPESAPSAPPWRKRLVVAILIVVAASIAARAHFASKKEQAAAERRSQPTTSTQLVPGTEPTEEPQAEEEPSGIEALLPYLTEGGVAMLIGLLLGMATRAIAKLLMFLVVLFLVGMHFLSAKGIVTVDWGAMQDLVLNVSKESGLASIVKHWLPSTGALGLGYILGLKRG